MFEHMAPQFSSNGAFTSLPNRSSPNDYLPNQSQFTAEPSSLMDHNEVYSITPSTSLVQHQEPPHSTAFASILPPPSPLFFGATFNNMPNSDDVLDCTDESTMFFDDLSAPATSLSAVGKSSAAVYTSSPSRNDSTTFHSSFRRSGCATAEISTSPLSSENGVCKGCGLKINDRFLLKVDADGIWHEDCLKCVACGRSLAPNHPSTSFDNNDGRPTCFVRDGSAYCRDDHKRLFSLKCSQCGELLKSDEMVLRSFQRIFHTRCFRCSYCAQELKTGDRYCCVDGQIVCQRDYHMVFLRGPLPVRSRLNPTHPMLFEFDRLRNHVIQSHHHHHHGSQRKIPKRPRTILNAQQRKAFKYAFERGSKPSRKVREQLARDTGLSVRVVQVWFQNQRAKIKKDQRKRETDKHSSSAGSLTLSTDSDGKSAADDEPKSPLGSIKSETDSDLEDFVLDDDAISGPSSVFSQPSISRSDSTDNHEQLHKSKRNTSVDEMDVSHNPIEKLCRMHHAYFAFT